MFIECNVINNRKRYVCCYKNDPLKDYFISAVPMDMSEDKALKLIEHLKSLKFKLSDKELRQFNKSIAYLKLLKEI